MIRHKFISALIHHARILVGQKSFKTKVWKIPEIDAMTLKTSDCPVVIIKSSLDVLLPFPRAHTFLHLVLQKKTQTIQERIMDLHKSGSSSGAIFKRLQVS